METFWALHFEEHDRGRYRPRVWVFGRGFNPDLLRQECERMNTTGHIATSELSARVRNARLEAVDRAEAIRLFEIERGER